MKGMLKKIVEMIKKKDEGFKLEYATLTYAWGCKRAKEAGLAYDDKKKKMVEELKNLREEIEVMKRVLENVEEIEEVYYEEYLKRRSF